MSNQFYEEEIDFTRCANCGAPEDELCATAGDGAYCGPCWKEREERKRRERPKTFTEQVNIACDEAARTGQPVFFWNGERVAMPDGTYFTPVHGVNCPKKLHDLDGQLHAEDDDTPFDVDGITYCGRCHRAL